MLAKEARSVDALPGILLSESIAPTAMRANGGNVVRAGLKRLALKVGNWTRHLITYRCERTEEEGLTALGNVYVTPKAARI